MSLAPNSSSRKFDVLQQRMAELEAQDSLLVERADVVRKLDSLSAVERIAALRSFSMEERFQLPNGTNYGDALREELLEQTKGLPPTSYGIANKPFTTKIGIISDLFLFKSFEGLAEFYPVYADNFDQIGQIDILLLVSTWRGIDGHSWHGVTSKTNELREKLFEEILPFFRERDVPIVFYSKEDPPNYSVFLPFAEQADYIFTSAAEMISKYEEDCPNAKSIEVLPFGVNPKFHSPIGSQTGPVKSAIPFAGSWFNHKYPARRKWGAEILDAVMASKRHDLVVFNRNSKIRNEKYKFPNRYAEALTSAVEHQELLDIQRVTDFGINLNSVVNSTTMFANRAIELQAQGTYVLS